jgi:hypothetical protein
MLIERGAENPPAIVTAGTVLISREEIERLAALYQPRRTEDDLHDICDALLDDVDATQRRWTEAALDPSSTDHKNDALAWAVAHFRMRLRQPGWTNFVDPNDMAAVTVIAAFRDLFASWVHHPLFGAMIGTAASQGFSLHAMGMFGAAKALALSGNRVAFGATEGPRPKIISLHIVTGEQDQMQIAMTRLEWADGTLVTSQVVRGAVIEAMASVQGRLNRLRPGMLILSGGAAAAAYDRLVMDGMAAAVDSHGKRHRGLSAVAAILPKVVPTRKLAEVRFGYAFYPVANRHHSTGQPVQIR